VFPSNCKVVIPAPPLKPLDWFKEGKVPVHAWFNSVDWSENWETDPNFDVKNYYSKKDILTAYESISAIIDRDVAILGDSTRVFVGGYSQGGMLSYVTLFQYPKQLGGIVGVCTSHVIDLDYSQIDMSFRKKTPVLVYLGGLDEYYGPKWCPKYMNDILGPLELSYEIKVKEDMTHSGPNGLNDSFWKDIGFWFHKHMH
jgi:predicted esterase